MCFSCKSNLVISYRNNVNLTKKKKLRWKHDIRNTVNTRVYIRVSKRNYVSMTHIPIFHRLSMGHESRKKCPRYPYRNVHIVLILLLFRITSRPPPNESNFIAYDSFIFFLTAICLLTSSRPFSSARYRA